MPSPQYDEMIFKLGDAAYERLWNKPNRPRSIDRVIKAAETLETLQVALQELESAMDAEQASYEEFKAAVDEEMASCEELVLANKKLVANAEAKAKNVETLATRKRNDVKAAGKALEKTQATIKQLESVGEVEKAKAMAANLKSSKLDLMKRMRECDDLIAEYDKIMNPKSGPGFEAIRARARQKDLQLQLDERTEAYNARIEELNADAAQKDEEVRAAQEYYEQALFLLGQECYEQRVADPALAAFYPKLDKLK